MPDTVVRNMVEYHLQKAYFAWQKDKTDRGSHAMDYPTIRAWFVAHGYDQSYAWYVCRGRRRMANMAHIRELAELLMATAVKKINTLQELLSWID